MTVQLLSHCIVENHQNSRLFQCYIAIYNYIAMFQCNIAIGTKTKCNLASIFFSVFNPNCHQ